MLIPDESDKEQQLCGPCWRGSVRRRRRRPAQPLRSLGGGLELMNGPSSFVDHTVFAYWDREVTSTSLVSLLGSGPDNHTAITVLFTLVLTAPQIISFPVPSRVRSYPVYHSRKVRRSARGLPHALSGRGSVPPPPPPPG